MDNLRLSPINCFDNNTRQILPGDLIIGLRPRQRPLQSFDSNSTLGREEHRSTHLGKQT